MLLQMGGRGNAANVAEAVGRVCARSEWDGYFGSFGSAWGFHGPDGYGAWLTEAGLSPRRVALIARTMRQQGRDGLLGWLRTTWPYAQRLPEDLRERFLSQCADACLLDCPLEADGAACVEMVRLEVEAVRPAAPAAPQHRQVPQGVAAETSAESRVAPVAAPSRR